MSRFRDSAISLLLVLAAAVIALMTLRPGPGTPPLPFGCIICGTHGGVDFLLNIALFVPLGMSAYWQLGSWKKTILIGIAFTLLIELLQWKVIPGRDASLGDLVANSAGTAAGILLAMVGATGLRAAGRLARTLAGAFAILSSIVIVATAWMLQSTGVKYGLFVQWKVSRENMDDFQGDLQSAWFNEKRVIATEAIGPRKFLNGDTRSASMRVTVGGTVAPTVRQSVIVRLASPYEEGFFLGQWKDAAIMRSSQVAARVRFRPLLIGLNGTFSGAIAPGGGAENLTLTTVSGPRAMTIARQGSTASNEVTIRRTVGLGWTLFLPWDVAVTPRWSFASALWLGVLVLPVAFFTSRSRRHLASAAALAVWPLLLTVGAILAASRVFGLSFPGVADWAGVIVGVLAGSALERLSPTEMPAPLNPIASSGTIHS